jgi:hypothetical protein
VRTIQADGDTRSLKPAVHLISPPLEPSKEPWLKGGTDERRLLRSADCWADDPKINCGKASNESRPQM